MREIMSRKQWLHALDVRAQREQARAQTRADEIEYCKNFVVRVRVGDVVIRWRGAFSATAVVTLDKRNYVVRVRGGFFERRSVKACVLVNYSLTKRRELTERRIRAVINDGSREFII